jgi:hypothetical protein
MPIVNTAIKTQINLLIEQTKILEQSQSQEAFASGLATIIETAIKSATVTLPPGSIITVGSPSTQSNAAPAIGTLS